MTTPNRDPRLRRHGFAAPVDARAAAGRLEAAADAMRAEQLERGRDAPAVEDPPTGLIDLAAIRAAVGGPVGEPVNPASVRWLAGEPEAEDEDPAGAPVPTFEEWLAETDDPDPEPDPEPEPAPVEVAQPQESPSPEPAPVPAVSPPPPAPAPVAVVPAVFRSERNTAHAEALAQAGAGQDVIRRLTWRSRHDPRSRRFGVRSVMAGSAPVTDHVWPVGPVLDQGTEGCCVGCGTADAANVLRLARADPPRVAAAPAMLGLPDALALYHRAQRLDDVPGEQYVGTSVLAGMKAGQEQGLWGGYLWAFGTKDVAQAVLQTGPVIVGVPWLSGMYDTGPGGLVQLAGDDTGAGHCLAVVGLRLAGPQGQPGPFFVWQNSWGTSYGAGGLGYIHHRDLARLLAGVGEAAIPTAGAQR